MMLRGRGLRQRAAAHLKQPRGFPASFSGDADRNTYFVRNRQELLKQTYIVLPQANDTVLMIADEPLAQIIESWGGSTNEQWADHIREMQRINGGPFAYEVTFIAADTKVYTHAQGGMITAQPLKQGATYQDKTIINAQENLDFIIVDTFSTNGGPAEGIPVSRECFVADQFPVVANNNTIALFPILPENTLVQEPVTRDELPLLNQDPVKQHQYRQLQPTDNQPLADIFNHRR